MGNIDPGPPAYLRYLAENDLPFPGQEKPGVLTPMWREYLESLDAWDVFVRVLWVAWGATALVAVFWLLPGPWDWLWFLLP